MTARSRCTTRSAAVDGSVSVTHTAEERGPGDGRRQLARSAERRFAVRSVSAGYGLVDLGATAEAAVGIRHDVDFGFNSRGAAVSGRTVLETETDRRSSTTDAAAGSVSSSARASRATSRRGGPRASSTRVRCSSWPAFRSRSCRMPLA